MEEENNWKGYVRHCPCLSVVQIPKAVPDSVLTRLFTKIRFTAAFQARKSPLIHKGCSSRGSLESDACCTRSLRWDERVGLHCTGFCCQPRDKNNRGVQGGMCHQGGELANMRPWGWALPSHYLLKEHSALKLGKGKMKTMTTKFKKCSRLKKGFYISAAVFLPRKFIFDHFSDLFF